MFLFPKQTTAATANQNARRKSSVVHHLFVIGSMSLLAGCALGPNYQAPNLSPADAYLNTAQDAISVGRLSNGWLELFDSKELTDLIEKAQSHNHTLKAAYQSVIAARAFARSSRADILPQLDAGIAATSLSESASISPDGISDDIDRYQADFAARWELDLFGRVRKSIRAAAAEAEAQEALYQDVMFTLQADIALHYFQINSLQSEIELVDQSRATRLESFTLVQKRFDTGTVSELDVAQAETLLATAEARHFELQRLQNSLVYSLATLVGETPTTFRFKPTPLNAAPPSVPVGIPSELLTRRPDIRQTERSLAAASERIGIAHASFFPRISISGTLGYSAFKWNKLFRPASEFNGLVSEASVPVFQGGRLRANAKRAKADFEQILEQYRQIAIEAITEVDDLLQSTRLLQAQNDALGRAVIASQRAREISTVQYERGVLDFITALDAERTALDVKQRQTQIQRAQFTNSINLIRALGGSWLKETL